MNSLYFSEQVYVSDIQAICSFDLPWEQLKDKTVLLSGATGLIGVVIVDVLLAASKSKNLDLKVIALGRNKDKAKKRFQHCWDSPQFSFISQDVTLPMPEIGNVDFIIHAASNTHPFSYASDPIGTITANVQGTQNLLDYAVLHATKRFVFLSSVEIYGENIGNVNKFSEESLGFINCNTLRAGYPESKRLGEAMCNAYAKKYNIDFVIPRLCRIYGPTVSEGDSKAIFQFLSNSLKYQDIVLKSKGSQYYSYCYVADAVSGILYILLKGETGHAYNIADNKSNITLRDLALLIASYSETNVVFDLPSATETLGFSKATKAILDPTKLQSLGWKALSPISKGIKKTLTLMENNNEKGR